MTHRLRVGLVGAGIQSRHLVGYAWRPDLFDIKVLCSLDEDRGRELCTEFNIPEYTQSFQSLLDRDDIDVIDIATPPNLHFEQSKAAILAGKHVICEKPLFGSVAEVDEMERIVSATDRSYMPIFQYRYGMGLQKLKHLVAEGLAGKPYMTTIETHWWRPAAYYEVPWRGKWATELGGGFLGHAIHAHDMLNYVHGDATEVFAFDATLVNPIEVEDNVAAAVRMANGSLAALSMTLGSRKEISRLRFCYENLVAESILEPYTMARDPWAFFSNDDGLQKRIDDALASVKVTEDGYTRQFELFHEAIVTGGPLPVTLTDARRSLELVTAAYHSARTGRPASLPIQPDHPLYHSWLPQPADKAN
jgi:predicted dehydrogenase